MGITSTKKVFSTDKISCGDFFNVSLSLTAEPDILTSPVDIVMVLDRSSSMQGVPLRELKSGAKEFIDIIERNSNSTTAGIINGGSRIGIVSFASTATVDETLTTNIILLKNAINSLNASGTTNHADAFTKAAALFDMTSPNRKIMVLFTDGVTTAGGNPDGIVETAKSAGIVVYCIGLMQGSMDPKPLERWASDPAVTHVLLAPSQEKLQEAFSSLAKNISKAGATNIKIVDHLSPCFKVVSLGVPTNGVAKILSDTAVEWEIGKLGVNATESASVEFKVQHIGPCTGLVAPNEKVEYSDAEGGIVNFQGPMLEVVCDETFYPEKCPVPVPFTVAGCEDAIKIDAGNLSMESLGRILQVSATLKNVCPNKRVALAALLSEVMADGSVEQRGFKAFTIPAHQSGGCRDVKVDCIKFVLPEDLNEVPTSLCNSREFQVRFIANYVDYDFVCCEEETPAP